MNPDSVTLRVGVVDQTISGWTAAGVYSRMILRSLEAANRPPAIQLCFFTSQEISARSADDSPVQTIKLESNDYLPAERQIRRLLRIAEKAGPIRGEFRVRKLLGIASAADVFASAEKNKIDVLLPLLDIPPWKISPGTIGWIPDFQHIYLPGLFNKADLDQRDSTFQRVAERASLVMLSSKAAYDDFAAFAPAHAKKARVISFPSLLAFDSLSGEPAETRSRFNLPEKFALVANQFWSHKNHALVVKALASLKSFDPTISVVMTGLPADHRDPTNKAFSSLLQTIATAGLHEQIRILGLVSYHDLINLMRAAALVIQPSRFEGWSTVVQDAKALGRPLLCSDIPVHREQATNCLGFFSTDDPEGLASLLKSKWSELTAGPDVAAEERSLAHERSFASAHGQALIDLCTEAAL